MSVAISMRNVSLQMHNTIHLQRIDLELDFGETVVVAGDVGSGKSLLLRMVLGLPGIQREDEVRLGGEVVVDGKSVFGLSSGGLRDLRRRIGLVKSDGGLIENMDVRQNITLPLTYHSSKMGAEFISERYEAILAALDCTEFSESRLRPVALNRVQQVYVSLARALIVDPVILLADDPTRGLGVQATEGITRHLFSSEMQLTRLIATTRLTPYLDRANRFFLLEDGQVVPLGDTGELMKCDHPWIRAELSRGNWD